MVYRFSVKRVCSEPKSLVLMLRTLTHLSVLTAKYQLDAPASELNVLDR
jgi:hypothetical protein